MADDGKALRRELGQGEGGRGKRYSGALRERVVAWVATQRRGGMSWSAIGKELGLSLDTLRRWCLGPSKSKKARSMVRVRVVPSRSETRTVSVVSPSGFRIDGLSPAEAATLLQALG